jgi:glycosyltransferase involved in cell wall biosynthesis
MEGKKIIFICSRLDTPGGIERAVVNTANLFAQKGHRVTLLVADTQGNASSVYPLHIAVQLNFLPLSFGIGIPGNPITRKLILFRNIRQLKKHLNQQAPEVIITTEYPFSAATVLSGAGKKARIIAWEHQHHNWVKKNKFWSWLQEKTYPRLEQIVCLNKSEAAHFNRYAPVTVIPNFIEQVYEDNQSYHKKQLLTVGWLIPRKGTDLLLPVAKNVLNAFPDFTWKLVGDGELKGKVQDFIRDENLEGRLLLQPPGKTEIDSVYRESGLFVLPSRFEAFPMVLLEALSYGIPCISFNCPSGPSDIITNKEDGWLIEPENTAQLTEAIIQLLKEPDQRVLMAKSALKNIRRFDKENIYPLWATLLNKTQPQ